MCKIKPHPSVFILLEVMCHRLVNFGTLVLEINVHTCTGMCVHNSVLTVVLYFYPGGFLFLITILISDIMYYATAAMSKAKA